LVEDKFKWPKGNDEALAVTGQQLNWPLEGYGIAAMKAHKSRHYKSVS
jgi:transposase